MSYVDTVCRACQNRSFTDAPSKIWLRHRDALRLCNAPPHVAFIPLPLACASNHHQVLGWNQPSGSMKLLCAVVKGVALIALCSALGWAVYFQTAHDDDFGQIAVNRPKPMLKVFASYVLSTSEDPAQQAFRLQNLEFFLRHGVTFSKTASLWNYHKWRIFSCNLGCTKTFRRGSQT
jgi:hypothetical protein